MPLEFERIGDLELISHYLLIVRSRGNGQASCSHYKNSISEEEEEFCLISGVLLG